MIRKPKKSVKKKVSKKITKRKVSQNPIISDELIIIDNFGNRPSLSDIENWMIRQMKNNPNYDPHAISYKAGKYFNINAHFTKPLDILAFDVAEKFEYDKQRRIQRKAIIKTKEFPLGLGNAPFKKKNPDGQIKPNGITLDEIKVWMIKYMKKNLDYEPRDMANHAILHLNIVQVTPKDKEIIRNLAYKTADEYEMSR